ncbi:MAG: SCP2 sterol-binding domain-containing protein [Anaerolineales bacterium]|nr:SCP2 sterol-binding domain-containing protein [Chloroflexota bacterium]MBL6982361.1 SCP2 sterol-binding domain-containing protein [Anaerolineales bacterium]
MSDLTVKELIFNHEKAFQADKAAGVEAVIQYHLTGDEGGDYIINIKDDACTVDEGTAEAAVMTLTADGRYFGDVLLGKEDGMKGFMQGKLKLAGDLNLAMKLTSFFKMG